MRDAFLRRATFSNVVAVLALFVALGGASYAATQLPKNSVGTKQLKKNAVTTAKIKRGAVRGAKIAGSAVTGAKIADGTIPTGKLADGAVDSAALANGAVTGDKLADNAVTGAKLADDAVSTTKIAANAVTQGKLADGSVGSPQLKDITTTTATSAKVANGGSIGVTATCPSGTAIAGGFETESTGGAKWIVKRLVRSGNGWRVFGVNESGSESTIIAIVYCLTA
jgi:hypothetical protein